jgi:hypothetical protein
MYDLRVTRVGVMKLPGLWFIYETDGIPRFGWYGSGMTLVNGVSRYPWSRTAAAPVAYRGAYWAARVIHSDFPGAVTSARLVDSTVRQARDALGGRIWPGADWAAPVSAVVVTTSRGSYAVLEDLESGELTVPLRISGSPSAVATRLGDTVSTRI